MRHSRVNGSMMRHDWRGVDHRWMGVDGWRVSYVLGGWCVMRHVMSRMAEYRRWRVNNRRGVRSMSGDWRGMYRHWSVNLMSVVDRSGIGHWCMGNVMRSHHRRRVMGIGDRRWMLGIVRCHLHWWWRVGNCKWRVSQVMRRGQHWSWMGNGDRGSVSDRGDLHFRGTGRLLVDNCVETVNWVSGVALLERKNHVIGSSTKSCEDFFFFK